MNLYEAIFLRKTVRNYLNDDISDAVLERIKLTYKNLVGLFGNIETDISIWNTRKGQPRHLGLLSSKAPYYIAFYSENAPRAMMNTGYLMEQMALYLCTQGIGSSFLGKSRVLKNLRKKGDKELIGILGFGKSRGAYIRRQSDANRLPMEELCLFKEQPRQWMKQLLDAARMAPSYMNHQPWRFVVYDNRIHIFSKKQKTDHMNKWDEVNFGILFANFMVAAEEMWLDVDLIRLENISQKNFPNNRYVLSAILKT